MYELWFCLHLITDRRIIQGMGWNPVVDRIVYWQATDDTLGLRMSPWRTFGPAHQPTTAGRGSCRAATCGRRQRGPTTTEFSAGVAPTWSRRLFGYRKFSDDGRLWQFGYDIGDPSDIQFNGIGMDIFFYSHVRSIRAKAAAGTSIFFTHG
jgi:hypothetical protein